MDTGGLLRGLEVRCDARSALFVLAQATQVHPQTRPLNLSNEIHYNYDVCNVCLLCQKTK